MSGIEKHKKYLFVFSVVFFLNFSLYSGDIKGKISSEKKTARKVVQRYPGKHVKSAKKLEPLPAIIMLLGPVKGHPPSKPLQNAKIIQKNFQFEPQLLIVPINSKVEFPNMDTEFHNVFSYSKIKRFDLGRYHKGESKTVTFKKPGVGKIYCEIHEWMRAAIIVVENPFYTVADMKGYYEIKNIPPGTYEFLIWKIDHKKQISEIVISEKGISEINFSLPEKKNQSRENR